MSSTDQVNDGETSETIAANKVMTGEWDRMRCSPLVLASAERIVLVVQVPLLYMQRLCNHDHCKTYLMDIVRSEETDWTSSCF